MDFAFVMLAERVKEVLADRVVVVISLMVMVVTVMIS